MLRRQFFGLMATFLVVPVMAARAEDRREQCDGLDREERELRGRLDHEHDLDRDERDRIEHRLHDIAEQRDRDCR
jgi:hypothetical protein